MEDPVLFVLTVLAILGTPGPTNTLLATAGAAMGVRRSLMLIPAEAGGYLIAILILGLLAGPVIAASPWLGLTLRLLVGAYLMRLAWRLWRGEAGPAAGKAAVITPVRIFITTLLNPKAILFALSVIPFQAAGVWPYLAGFVGLAAMVALAWIAIGAGAGRMADAAGWARLVPRIGASAIGGFAAILLLAPLLR